MTSKGSPIVVVVRRCTKRSTVYRDRVSPAIAVISSSAAAILPFVHPGRPTGGGRTASPATIIGGCISIYHAFVVCIMFAFSCALSAMFLYRKREAARVLRLSAITWLSSAVLLFIHAVFCNRSPLLIM